MTNKQTKNKKAARTRQTAQWPTSAMNGTLWLLMASEGFVQVRATPADSSACSFFCWLFVCVFVADQSASAHAHTHTRCRHGQRRQVFGYPADIQRKGKSPFDHLSLGQSLHFQVRPCSRLVHLSPFLCVLLLLMDLLRSCTCAPHLLPAFRAANSITRSWW